MSKDTESSSLYRHLEKMRTPELLRNINSEDQKVAEKVGEVIPQIGKLVDHIAGKMVEGGRLFYMGSGTSGRLGIVDASECPPTFGVEHGLVTGIIAGGDTAIRRSREFAEDDTEQGWEDLRKHEVNPRDVVVGLSASGTTPYVIGALKICRENHITTGCITCNHHSPLAAVSDHPVEVVVGPEFVTGSTRMKAGTAQKMVLNMISTSVMIRLGRVKDNKMVDMQLSNRKLIERGTRMIMDLFNLPGEEARSILLKYGSVRKVIEHYDFERRKLD